MKQTEAVVTAVTEVLGDRFTAKETNVAAVITKEEKQIVRESVVTGITNGDITYNKDIGDTATVTRYVNGMVDNHIRKNKALNGDTIYKPMRTGTKRDLQLKNLTRLLNSGKYEQNSQEYGLIVTHIELRTKELEAVKASKKSNTVSQIDTSVLPQHLADMVIGQEPTV